MSPLSLRPLLALLLVVAAAPTLLAQAPAETVAPFDPAKAFPGMLKTITEDECFEHVQVLAAPDKRGRGTMTPGFDLAADYVIAELTAAGLQGAGPDGSFKMPITLPAFLPGEACSFDWSGRPMEEDAPVVEKDFVPVLGSPDLAAEGEAVFVGYAIDSKKEKWVDLNPRDVKGKVVFAFTREPRADDRKFKRFEGAASTRESALVRKAQAVYDAGGIGLVLVPDPGLVPEEDIPLPGMVPYVSRGGGGTAAQMTSRLGFPEIPVVSVSRAVAGRIFDTDLTAYHASIDKKLKPKLLEAEKDLRVSLRVAMEAGSRETYNLGAVIKGSSGSGKVLVLGAHLDHVGFDLFSQAETLRTSIHPGADDNASGSAALLEVAEAFAGHPPVHDILFLWFTGEELGLLGAREYCADPLYPHEDTIAMLNMDMVGRGDDKLINIGGLWDRPAWADFIKKQHKRSKSKLKMDNDQGRDLYARSDHFMFHQEGVVALFFFEADLPKNKVYHQVGDVPEDIDGRKMERICQLFAATAWALAYEDLRP